MAELLMQEVSSQLRHYGETHYFYSLDPHFRFEYVCSAVERLWGRSFLSLKGKVIWDEFPSAKEDEGYARHVAAMHERMLQRYSLFLPQFQRRYCFTLRPLTSGSLYCFFEEERAN